MRKSAADKQLITIGERIKKARSREGLTQEFLSDCIGITSQYLSDLERGKVGTSIYTLSKICDCLNVSADYILRGKELEADTLM